MVAQRVLSLSELPEVGAVRVIVDGLPVAVVRDGSGTVHAVGDTCSHADVSLSQGEVEGCRIECWLHGSQFDLRTGRPTSPPALVPIPVYTVSFDGDSVLVDVVGAAVHAVPPTVARRPGVLTVPEPGSVPATSGASTGATTQSIADVPAGPAHKES